MVVVSGIGIVSAIGRGVEENLESLRHGRSGIGSIENFDTEIDVPVGEVKMSNDELTHELGIDTRRSMSRTSLLGMMAAEEALSDAMLNDRQHVALISSTSVGGMDMTPLFYEKFMKETDRGRLRYVAQHDCAASTNAIAKHCGIEGYRTAISTACSSAANSIQMASRLIENGLADTVIAGGTDALCRYTIDGFKSLMILDTECCRPFDDTRSGLNLGEAAAYVVLQSESIARKKYCYLAGYANANDAFHQTAVSSSGAGPRKAMEEALLKAGMSPNDISYINAHGTGTPNNDASELTAIESIWGDRVPLFSSTKSMTGHTLAAAGAIEAVYSVLALQYQQVWPNINFVNPMSDKNSVPVRECVPCEVNAVLSNSFGFGGNCTSLIFRR